MRTGRFRDLFHPDHLMSDREDFANNYARGFTLGAPFARRVLEMVRKVADSCDGLQGFILCHSLGGGTGSGVPPHIMQGLADGYGKKSKLQLSVYPAPQVGPTISLPVHPTRTSGRVNSPPTTYPTVTLK